MSQLILKKSFSRIIFAVGFATATQVNAATYLYEIDNPTPSSDKAGKISSFATTYHDVNEQLSFLSTIQKTNGNLANGFWLVLSEGPNPKKHTNEYAIFYGDGNTGNLTTYVYNGANSSSSWKGEFIESFTNGLTIASSADEVTFEFLIDVSYINAFTPTTHATYGNDWDGASFGEKIGIWYHPTVFSKGPTYDSNGLLTSFPIEKSGWYDTADQKTTPILPDVGTVPAPATAWLVLVGLMGFAGANRRRI